jgi:hypothetical protein
MRSALTPGRLLTVAVAVCLSAATASAEELRFRTRHYDVTTDLDRETAREVGEHMDEVYDEYARRFSRFGKRNAEPLRLWVFRTREGYAEFLAGHRINAIGSGGMFFRRDDAAGLASYLGERPMESMLETLRHEGMHQFTYQRIGDGLPPWLNEGMAEWFGYAMKTRRGFAMGLADPRAVARLRRAAAEDRLIPFDELMTMTQAAWNERVRTGQGSVQYDQSWSVVQFLVYADDGRYEPALMKLLNLLWSGLDPQRAVAQAFGQDLRPMEDAWRRALLELEPDELYRGRSVLAAYAEVLGALDGAGVRPASPADFDRAVEGHGPELELPGVILTPLGEMPLTLDVDAWWRTPPTAQRGGRPAVLRFIPDRRDELPPGVELRGLRHRVTLTWERGRDGQLEGTIEVH